MIPISLMMPMSIKIIHAFYINNQKISNQAEMPKTKQFAKQVFSTPTSML